MIQGPRRNYTIINHEARIALKINLTEYCVFDLIHHLATHPKNNKNGWCYAKKETIANYLALNRATVFRAISKGLELGLLEKHSKQPTFLRATRNWYKTVEIRQVAPRRTVRLQPLQIATADSRKMRHNKDTDKENDKFPVEPQKNISVIGHILDEYHFPNDEAHSTTEWQVEAKRHWQTLGLAGEPSQQFFKHIKGVYTTKQHRKLARVISYCIDAPSIRDKERFFYWRYAHDP